MYYIGEMAEFLEFGQYKKWLDESKKSQTTKEKNLRDVEKFLRFCGKSIPQLVKQDILDYKASLVVRHKPASVNSYLLSLNNFLMFLGRDDLREKTVKVQRRKSLNDVLTEEEYAALLEKAGNRADRRLYCLVRTFACTGIRVGELQYITVEGLRTGHVAVYGGTKTRTVRIPQSLCRELEQYCEEQHINGMIFHGSRPDIPLDKVFIWRELKQLAREAGVPEEKVHCQKFRHLFAKMFLTHHHDIKDLADILGYSSVDTARLYARANKRERQGQAGTSIL